MRLFFDDNLYILLFSMFIGLIMAEYHLNRVDFFTPLKVDFYV